MAKYHYPERNAAVSGAEKQREAGNNPWEYRTMELLHEGEADKQPGNAFGWLGNLKKPADSGGYTPGSGLSGGADYAGQLKSAYEAQAQARADALEKMIASYQGQSRQIAQDYDRAASQAYADARLSAIGNNEILAANGLAGGLYQAPTSGYSETSRVAQDNALRYNLNEVALARARAQKEVEDDINALRVQGMYAQADLAAQHARQLIDLQMQLDEQRYQRAVDAANTSEDDSYYKQVMGIRGEDEDLNWWWYDD